MQTAAGPHGGDDLFRICSTWRPQIHTSPTFKWGWFPARRHAELWRAAATRPSAKARNGEGANQRKGDTRWVRLVNATHRKLCDLGDMLNGSHWPAPFRRLVRSPVRPFGHSPFRLFTQRFGKKIGHILLIDRRLTKGAMPVGLVAGRDQNKLTVCYRVFRSRDESEFGRVDLIIGKVDRENCRSHFPKIRRRIIIGASFESINQIVRIQFIAPDRRRSLIEKSPGLFESSSFLLKRSGAPRHH